MFVKGQLDLIENAAPPAGIKPKERNRQVGCTYLNLFTTWYIRVRPHIRCGRRSSVLTKGRRRHKDLSDRAPRSYLDEQSAHVLGDIPHYGM